MYLKIENVLDIILISIIKALKSQIKDIDLMKTKIEKLEEEDDMFAKTGKSSRKMKMCEAILKDGKCSLEGKCTFGHTAIELDMVKNEKKIESL
jgi:chaperonin cofactor prefoldin